MIGLLLGLVVLGSLGLFLAGNFSGFLEFTGFILTLISVVGLGVYVFLGFDYVSAGYKVGVLNKEYGTSYTQEEVFYASDVIDTIQKLPRKRVEVIVTGEK